MHKNLESIPFCNGPGEQEVLLKVGDFVVDGLTTTLRGTQKVVNIVKVLEIWVGDGMTFGLKLDSTYLDGLRHPWEITVPTEENGFKQLIS